MEIELTVTKKFEVKYLQAEVGARYWEDATVNGVEDTNGTLIPCRDGEYWKPLIELETGKIINWDAGTTAKVHYKSCDDNLFIALDADKKEVKKINSYVINMMCPFAEGFGDYVIMNINEDGIIENFIADFSDFKDFSEQ